MSEKIRIGFVGVGQIAQNHLKAYQKIEGAEIVAAADINEEQLNKVAEEFEIADCYSDFHEMLKRDDIDAIDVCLHNNLHMPVTLAALKAGKDVYCEKPMAGSYIDAKTMYDTAIECNQKLHIQLAQLYSNETRISKYMIDNGRLGKLYHARSTGYRRRGRPFVDGYGAPAFVDKKISAGGALYDMGVYHISQMLYLLGNPSVERISGKTYQETALDSGRKESSGYNVEELGLGFVRLENNISLDIIEAWAVHMDAFEGSSLYGSEGGIRLEPFKFFNTVDDLLNDTVPDANNLLGRWKSVLGKDDSFDSSQHHWIAALQGRCELLPTAQIALNTMLISEGIYMSCEQGCEIGADDVLKNSISTAVNI